jgi:hypothetical protein
MTSAFSFWMRTQNNSTFAANLSPGYLNCSNPNGHEVETTQSEAYMFLLSVTVPGLTHLVSLDTCTLAGPGGLVELGLGTYEIIWALTFSRSIMSAGNITVSGCISAAKPTTSLSDSKSSEPSLAHWRHAGPATLEWQILKRWQSLEAADRKYFGSLYRFYRAVLFDLRPPAHKSVLVEDIKKVQKAYDEYKLELDEIRDIENNGNKPKSENKEEKVTPLTTTAPNTPVMRVTEDDTVLVRPSLLGLLQTGNRSAQYSKTK